MLGLLGLEACDAAVQATSSCGLKPGIRLRLWLLLDRPTDDDELRRWALATNRALGRVIDPALYSPAQIHYTAPPSFEHGMTDPVPKQVVVHHGYEREAHLEIPAQTELPADLPQMGTVGVSTDERLAAVGGELGFHAPLKSLVAAAVARHGNALDRARLKGQVRQHLAGLGETAWGGRDAGERERYASDRFLDDLLSWASARDQEQVERVQTLAHRLGVGR